MGKSERAPHTPTPWRVDETIEALTHSRDRSIVGPDSSVVAEAIYTQYTDKPTRDANAAFIVEACNAHDKLFTALWVAIHEWTKFGRLNKATVEAAREALALCESQNADSTKGKE